MQTLTHKCSLLFFGGTIAFDGFGFRKPLLMIWYKLLVKFESGLFFFWPCFYNKKTIGKRGTFFRLCRWTQIVKLTRTWGPVNHKKIDTWCTQYYLLVVKVSRTVAVCRNKKEGLSAWYWLDLWVLANWYWDLLAFGLHQETCCTLTRGRNRQDRSRLKHFIIPKLQPFGFAALQICFLALQIPRWPQRLPCFSLLVSLVPLPGNTNTSIQNLIPLIPSIASLAYQSYFF